MKQIFLALLCCLAVGAIGCTGSSPADSYSPVSPLPCGFCPAPIPFEFETVYEGCDGTYIGGEIYEGQFYCIVLHSQEELNAFWASQWSDPAPQVNFDNAWVVAIYAPICGGCCSGTWVVQSAEETPDCISIEIQEVDCSAITCDGNAECACAVLVTIPPADKPVCLNGSPAFTCPWF